MHRILRVFIRLNRYEYTFSYTSMCILSDTYISINAHTHAYVNNNKGKLKKSNIKKAIHTLESTYIRILIY